MIRTSTSRTTRTTATSTPSTPGIVTPPHAPNVTRIIVEGSTTVPDRFEYLRLTIDPRSDEVFSWDRLDYNFAP